MQDGLADEAWRDFWFRWVLRDEALAGWHQNTLGVFEVNEESSHIRRFDGGGYKKFFVGRSDSIKNKLVKKLNAGAIGPNDAWEELAQNYRNRAHSYREDIDSGCEHLGLIDEGGRLTDLGYRFVDACERYGNPNEGIPRAIFLYALLNEGSLGAFLHYVHRLSNDVFTADPLRFTVNASTSLRFQQDAYLAWLEEEMATNLKVMRKVSARGGVSRKPFQAELALLRGLGIVSSEFRIGLGLAINWPELHEAMNFI